MYQKLQCANRLEKGRIRIKQLRKSNAQMVEDKAKPKITTRERIGRIKVTA